MGLSQDFYGAPNLKTTNIRTTVPRLGGPCQLEGGEVGGGVAVEALRQAGVYHCGQNKQISKHLLPLSKYKFTLLINSNNFIRKWAQIS